MCNFPAMELLRMRKQLEAQAEQSNDRAFVHRVTEFIEATNALRLAHFESSDCLCWQEAAERFEVRA